MFQTVLLFLAPAQGLAGNGPSATAQPAPGQSSTGATTRTVHVSRARPGKPFTAMATRIQPTPAPRWLLRTSSLWVVAGNALGFIVFMSGLGMLLRLAEVLLS